MFDLIAAAVIAMTSHHQLSPVTDTTVVLEDDPAWDCPTMGNLVCGVGNTQGVEPGFYGGDPAEPIRSSWVGRAV